MAMVVYLLFQETVELVDKERNFPITCYGLTVLTPAHSQT